LRQIVKKTGSIGFRSACFAAVALAPLLAGCSHKNAASASGAGNDVQSEQNREQDCADPQWKADNLGLWDNICLSNSHH
jgi:hypothetical protein